MARYAIRQRYAPGGEVRYYAVRQRYAQGAIADPAVMQTPTGAALFASHLAQIRLKAETDDEMRPMVSCRPIRLYNLRAKL